MWTGTTTWEIMGRIEYCWDRLSNPDGSPVEVRRSPRYCNADEPRNATGKLGRPGTRTKRSQETYSKSTNGGFP